MNYPTKTVIIIGSGFSLPFGMPTTYTLNKFMDIVCGNIPLEKRVLHIMELFNGGDEIFKNDMYNTLKILGDSDYENINVDDTTIQNTVKEYANIFRNYIDDVDYDTLCQYTVNLNKHIDWLALKAVYNIFRHNGKTKNYNDNTGNLVKTLTILQKAINDSIAIPIKNNDTIEYIYPERLYKALNAYKLLIFKIFKNVLRIASKDEKCTQVYDQYLDFFLHLVKRLIKADVYETEKNGDEITQHNFIVLPVGFLSFNWDPIITHLLFKTNQKINKEFYNYGNIKDNKMRIYVDFGFPFPIITLKGHKWNNYSFSIEVASIINHLVKDKPLHIKIVNKVIKLFNPNGLINLRQCPRCHNTFMFFGHKTKESNFENLYHIFMPDPLPCEGFLKIIKKFDFKHVESYIKGKPDEIKCTWCHHPTYFKDSCMEIQSIIKNMPLSILNKIQYDYAEFYGKADNVISFGYSFPVDDIINNFFTDLMSVQYGTYQNKTYKIVNFSKIECLQQQRWMSLEDVKQIVTKDFDIAIQSLINNLNNLYGNVYINFTGFPEYLEDIHKVIDDVIQEH